VELRDDISQQGGVGMVVTELDQIAWLLNLRGKGDSLIESLMHSPTFQSMLLVHKEKVSFIFIKNFVKTNKLFSFILILTLSNLFLFE
jgi:hypothetical protein